MRGFGGIKDIGVNGVAVLGAKKVMEHGLHKLLMLLLGHNVVVGIVLLSHSLNKAIAYSCYSSWLPLVLLRTEKRERERRIEHREEQKKRRIRTGK